MLLDPVEIGETYLCMLRTLLVRPFAIAAPRARGRNNRPPEAPSRGRWVGFSI